MYGKTSATIVSFRHIFVSDIHRLVYRFRTCSRFIKLVGFKKFRGVYFFRGLKTINVKVDGFFHFRLFIDQILFVYPHQYWFCSSF
jgi:hypothetical protein